MLRLSLISGWALAVVLAGCTSSGEDSADSGADVVATTTHVADLAREVAGERADVHGILSASADPHDYEPRPSDTAALGEASVILTSGGEIDAWVEELIESSGSDATVVSMVESASVTRELEGEIDPHWWQDPRNAVAAVEAIRDELTEADPEGEADYAKNAAALVREIERADRALAACMDKLPADARRMVTSHDSLGYLAERYGIEIVGAAIPALSTQAQPSAGETAQLVELIETENVRAVFPEAGLPDDLERAIAGEAGIEVGDPLYADALGEEGTPADSYLGALIENGSRLAEGLSGGSLSCDSPGDG